MTGPNDPSTEMADIEDAEKDVGTLPGGVQDASEEAFRREVQDEAEATNPTDEEQDNG